MFLRLLLLFTTVPLVELALLLWIGRHIGVLPTVLLIFLTGALGAALARYQGLAAWQRLQDALAAGRLPGRELVEGFLILLAGAVLLTPGVLTDAAGFLLLVPPARRWIVRTARARLEGRMVVVDARGGGKRPEGPGIDVIDAEFEVLDRGEGTGEDGTDR
ncbi:MAG: FxsA family protein [Thermoanaerobaculia bacterium]